MTCEPYLFINHRQEIPGVVSFHCLNMKSEGILGNRERLQFGLDQFWVSLKVDVQIPGSNKAERLACHFALFLGDHTR